MKFTKMQGIGNDYVYINDIDDTMNDLDILAQHVSERHFGIGSDGLIVIKPSDHADFFMKMYNADGSEGKMCGNGIRCFAKLVHDLGLSQETTLSIETLSGIKQVELIFEDGIITGATVDMGEPIVDPKTIPVDDPQHRFDLEIAGKTYPVTALSMGNPHIVTFVEQPDTLDLMTLGPEFEHHPKFPEGVNTEFVEVIDRKHLKMRVWERGSGETLACGTGACAVCVAAHLNGYCDREVTVHLLGGDLEIHWDEQTRHVWMSGPVKTVFTGELYLENEERFYGKH